MPLIDGEVKRKSKKSRKKSKPRKPEVREKLRELVKLMKWAGTEERGAACSGDLAAEIVFHCRILEAYYVRREKTSLYQGYVKSVQNKNGGRCGDVND